jgi:hypothetical protein
VGLRRRQPAMNLRIVPVTLSIFAFLFIPTTSVLASDDFLQKVGYCIQQTTPDELQSMLEEKRSLWMLMVSRMEISLRHEIENDEQTLRENIKFLEPKTISSIRFINTKNYEVSQRMIENMRSKINEVPRKILLINEHGVISWCICNRYLSSPLFNKKGSRLSGNSKREKVKKSLIRKYSGEDFQSALEMRRSERDSCT